MKKSICVILIFAVVLLLAFPALAGSPKNKIAVQPLWLSLGMLRMEYEGKMSSNASLVAETFAMVPGVFDTNEFILDLGLGTRYYPWGEALNGIYMGTGLHTLWLSGEHMDPVDNTIDKYKNVLVAGDFSLGYQLALAQAVSLDLGMEIFGPFCGFVYNDGDTVFDFAWETFSFYKLGVGFVW